MCFIFRLRYLFFISQFQVGFVYRLPTSYIFPSVRTEQYKNPLCRARTWERSFKAIDKPIRLVIGHTRARIDHQLMHIEAIADDARDKSPRTKRPQYRIAKRPQTSA